MAEMPKRLESATARFPLVRWSIGLVLGLMAIRGATDEILGVAQWSGAIWGFTSSLPIWIFLGVGSLFLLTVDLWLPRFLRHGSRPSAPAFVAVEAEVALAHEEAIEMAKLLRSEWPHITPEGAVVEVVLPDWKAKTTDFIGTALGAAQRAAFKGSSAGDDVLERLESEGKFLSELALRLAPESVRASESEVLEARRERRSHQAANFLKYDHSRAPGAPPKATATKVPQSVDHREFPRRDDPGDLAKRCHMLAGSVEKWVQGYSDRRAEATATQVDEMLGADPDLDPQEARQKAEVRYEKSWERRYRQQYATEAKKLFDEAWELHEVAKELEQLAVRPLAIQFNEVPKLFNEIAESLYASAA